MFPGLPSVDVTDTDALTPALRAALAADGPSVVSIECSADEIPPFVPFLTIALQPQNPTTRRTTDVAARA